MLETLSPEGPLTSEIGQAAVEKLVGRPSAFIHEIDRLGRLTRAAKTELFISMLFSETIAQEEDMSEEQLNACKLTRTLMTNTISRIYQEIKTGNNPEEQKRSKVILKELDLYHKRDIIPADLIPTEKERANIKSLITDFQAIEYQSMYMKPKTA